MRSGTHVLIDCILNNFARYRRRPLYIDLDQFVGQGLAWRQIAEHAGPVSGQDPFPASRAPRIGRGGRAAARRGEGRDPTPLGRGRAALERDLRHRLDARTSCRDRFERFDRFWSRVPHLSVEFAQLVDRERAPAQIERLAGFLRRVASRPAGPASRRPQRLRDLRREVRDPTARRPRPRHQHDDPLLRRSQRKRKGSEHPASPDPTLRRPREGRRRGVGCGEVKRSRPAGRPFPRRHRIEFRHAITKGGTASHSP